MKIHEIKLQEEFCDDVYEGRKTFEVRNNDRGYQTGDYVRFKSMAGMIHFIHPIEKKLYQITYVLSGWHIPQDYVVFSIKEVKVKETE